MRIWAKSSSLEGLSSSVAGSISYGKNIFFSLIPTQQTYFHVQQVALMEFPYHLMLQLGFKLASVELHHDLGPFEGRYTN